MNSKIEGDFRSSLLDMGSVLKAHGYSFEGGCVSSGISWGETNQPVRPPEEFPTTFIGIDLETTGLFPEKHGICQIGAWATGENMDDFKGYFLMDVNPHVQQAGADERRVSIDRKALEVNGFTERRISEGTYIWAAVKALDEWMRKWKANSNVICVAQNTPFDIAWLQNNYRAAGYETDMLRRHIDLYALSFLAFGKPLSLDSVCDKLGMRNRGAHDALADAYSTVKAFHRLRKRLPYVAED